MKTLLFLILLTITVNAQDLLVADSLLTASTSDIYKTNYALDMGEWYIVAKDTGATVTDSIKIYRGTVRKNKYTAAIIDTLWTQIPVKDPSFEDQTIIAAANSTTVWIPLSALPRLLKIQLSNATAVTGRKWEYVIEGNKNR